MIQKTSDKVVELRREEPNLRAVDIARRLGVSHERVRQILIKLNLHTSLAPPKVSCPGCGTMFRPRNQKQTYCNTRCVGYPIRYNRLADNAEINDFLFAFPLPPKILQANYRIGKTW